MSDYIDNIAADNETATGETQVPFGPPRQFEDDKPKDDIPWAGLFIVVLLFTLFQWFGVIWRGWIDD